MESRKKIGLSVVCSIGLVLGAAQVRAHGDDPHHPGHDDSLGIPGNPVKVSRMVTVDMTDAMRFSPMRITVKKGETIRFAVKNSGRLKHEMVLGTEKELRAHAELMRKFPEMEHSDPNQLSLEAGKSGELVWQFTKAGTYDFACLQPGHFEAGMRGKIAVQDGGTAGKVAASRAHGYVWSARTDAHASLRQVN